MLYHMNASTKAVRLPDIVAKIYDLLDPLDASERARVLQSVLGLLGDSSAPLMAPTGALPAEENSTGTHGHVKGPKALQWMKKHGVTANLLEHVFHLDGQFDVIATPPGSTKREQTINAYLLIGAQHLLKTDDSKFTESEAVALCKQTGCHDSANHATTRSKFGNRIAGTKDGYSLTTPGLDQAAALIKALGSASP